MVLGSLVHKPSRGGTAIDLFVFMEASDCLKCVHLRSNPAIGCTRWSPKYPDDNDDPNAHNKLLDSDTRPSEMTSNLLANSRHHCFTGRTLGPGDSLWRSF